MMQRLVMTLVGLGLMACGGAGDVAITVVEAENGQPLPNAQVSIADGPSEVTAAAGQWIFVEQPVGEGLVVKASYPGYIQGQKLVFAEKNQTSYEELGLVKQGALEVWVTDAFTGRLVNTVAPTVTLDRETVTGSPLEVGKYAYSIEKPGVYTVHVAADDQYDAFRQSVRVEHGPATFMEASLRPKASLQVSVLDAVDGTPLVGVSVSLLTVEGETVFNQSNSFGEVFFSGVSAGTVTLSAVWGGYAAGSLRYNVLGGEENPVTFRLTPLGSIRGLVREEVTNQPIAGARVTLMDTQLQGVTDGEGRFQFEGLPAGSGTIQVEATGYISESRGVEVRDGAFATPILDLTPRRPSPRTNVTTVDFDTDETQRSVSIYNDEPGTTLQFSIEEDVDWLTVTPASGAVGFNDVLSLLWVIDRTRLNLGDYERNVTLSTNGGDLDLLIRVTEGSDLCASVTELQFEADQDQLDIPLRNCGAGSLSYSVSTNQPWISLGSDGGSVSNETDAISVRVLRDRLPTGNYEGAVYINSPVEGGLTIPVYMVVDASGDAP